MDLTDAAECQGMREESTGEAKVAYLLHKLIIDVLVYESPGSSSAALAHVEK